MSNITEKDSMIINENNIICSSWGNKIFTSNNKTNIIINKIDQNEIYLFLKFLANLFILLKI
jgi:hypothetical protein